MIIGTAGHIDHGKTTLVKALTGVDTDRLKEEKARGISIELGYAYVPIDAGPIEAGPIEGGPLPGGAVLGFIDVPGHERLVHTMVAGAAGIDLALLVVAADDGVMPQTREHLAILELLGITECVVALTKADRADGGRLTQVSADIGALLAATPLAGSPVFAVNATRADDPGTQALREHLHALAARSQARSTRQLFRLAVDRVFTLTGHGTIVTGTVFAGQVSNGDVLTVMPAGTPVRVRSIHAQNRPAEAGHAGERCALNLAGIDTTAVRRGDWLAASGALAPSTRLDVRLTLLPRAAPSRLTSWASLHIHLGTAHQVAHAVLLESEALHAGQAGRVQLVFEAPLCAVPGEHFIARDAQAAHTLGGGVVIDPSAPARRRRTPQRLAWLAALERLPGDGMAPLIQAAPQGLKVADLARLAQLPEERLVLPRAVHVLGAGQGRFVLHVKAREALRQRALAALTDFHERSPEEPGADLARLRRMAAPELAEGLWRALMEELLAEGAVKRSGAWWHLPGHSVTLSAEDQALLEKLQPLIAAGRFDPPWVRDLAARVGEPEERVRAVLRKGAARALLYPVVRDLFYDRARVAELAAIVAQLAQAHGRVGAAEYRDAVCLGRKRAIQILEFFDRVGFTRRVRDTHVLRGGGLWME
jgi:selenocysteine-specific elongation factor